MLETPGFCLETPSHKTLFSIPPKVACASVSPGQEKRPLPVFLQLHLLAKVSISKENQNKPTLFLLWRPSEIYSPVVPLRTRQKESLPGFALLQCHANHTNDNSPPWDPSTATNGPSFPHVTQRDEPWTLVSILTATNIISPVLHSRGNGAVLRGTNHLLLKESFCFADREIENQ